MSTALWLFVAQAVLGAFDTLYYHEYRARLPALPGGRVELLLHGARSLVYALLFATLAHWRWGGALAILLFVLIALEIGITLADFVVEDRVRRPLGGVFPGERVTHALMGIIYGAALAFLVPVVWRWTSAPIGFAPLDADQAIGPVDPIVAVLLPLFALGVALSGLRDLGAARGLGWCRWPWGRAAPVTSRRAS